MTFLPFWPKFYLRPRDFRSSAWIKIIIRLAMFAKGSCSKRFSDTRCEPNISEYLLSSACFAKNSLVDFIRLHASLKTMTFLPETKFFSLYRKRPVYVYSAIQTYIPTLSLSSPTIATEILRCSFRGWKGAWNILDRRLNIRPSKTRRNGKLRT